MARSRRGRLRWAIAGGLVIALAAGAVVAWPYVQRYTGSAPPSQFYDQVQLEPALAPDYPRVLGVAHNAGNNLGTLSTALAYGADVIEIDVISARGQLVGPGAAAGHRRRLGLPGPGGREPGCTRTSW